MSAFAAHISVAFSCFSPCSWCIAIPHVFEMETKPRGNELLEAKKKAKKIISLFALKKNRTIRSEMKQR
jgi:hypothetical protein